MEVSWGLLGACRRSGGCYGEIKTSTRVSPLGPFLVPSWALSWALLGPLGPSGAFLGPLLSHLGALEGASWAVLHAVKAEYVYMYMCMYMYICIHIYRYVYMYICIYVHMYVRGRLWYNMKGLQVSLCMLAGCCVVGMMW